MSKATLNQLEAAPTAPAPADRLAGLPPRPEAPPVKILAPPDSSPGWPDLSPLPFEDDVVPSAWWVFSPVPSDAIETLSRGAADPAWYPAADWILGTNRDTGMLRPLPESAWVDDSYPDGGRAIDLAALGLDAPGRRALFLTVVRIPEPVQARVCPGAIGEGVESRLWLNGEEVSHGAFVELRPGDHRMMALAEVGPRRPWQWEGCRIAPRLTRVTPEEIEAVHAWKLDRWRVMRDAAKMDEAALLAGVRMDPATLRGTPGFHQVGKDKDGRWWLVGPDGRPTVYRGVCAPNRGGTGGRRMRKPPLPPETVADWTRTMRAWGFNQIGCWATLEFYEAGLGHVEMIDTYYVKPWIQTKFPDVFDPAWEAAIEARCAEFCPPLRESRNLVGYYLENERGFMETLRFGVSIEARGPVYQAHGVPERRQVVNKAEPITNPRGIGLLQYLLSLDSDAPGVRRAREFVRERHGGIPEAGQAWGMDLSGPHAVNRRTVDGQRLIAPAYLRDEQDFVRIWARRYFEVVVGAIRRHDPNHLILGMRWAAPPSDVVLEEELNWVDVVSQNNYRAEMVERLDLTCSRMDRPLLIGECAVDIDSAWYVPNPIEPPGGYASPEERQELRNADAFDQVFRHPGIIGYTWYKWGGSKPAPERVQALREANLRSTALAAGAVTPPGVGEASWTGHVHLALQQAVVEAEDLPSPEPGAPPSRRTSAQALYLGLVIENDRFRPEIRGNAIRGRITDQQTGPDRWRLTFEVECGTGLYQLQEGAGTFEVEIERADGRLTGRHRGAWNGLACEGKALGYLHRPVASTRV